jgi:hypothetical protein
MNTKYDPALYSADNMPYSRARGALYLLPAVDSRQVKSIYSTDGLVSSVDQGIYYSTSLPGLKTGNIMNDIVTPNFKALQRSGIIINTPMTKESHKCDLVPFTGIYATEEMISLAGVVSGTVYKNTYACTNYICGHTEPGSLWNTYNLLNSNSPEGLELQRIRIQAVNEAFNKTKQSDLLGIVDLAEMGKTIEMLDNDCRRLAFLLATSKVRRFPKTSSKAMKSRETWRRTTLSQEGKRADAASLWLEVQYGVVPLMFSIDGVRKLLHDQVNTAIRQTFRGSESFSTHEVDISSRTYAWGGVTHCNSTFNSSYSVEAYARAGVVTEYKPSMMERAGLSAVSAPQSAYDLIKMSFVLDWWWDLNTYIGALSSLALPGRSHSWVTTSVVESYKFQYVQQGLTAELPFKPGWSITGGSYSTNIGYSRELKQRIPGVMPGVPGINTQFKSIKHAITALALTVVNGRRTIGARI